MVDSVAKRLGVPCDEAETAANEAAAEGWLTIEGGHSVCLSHEDRELSTYSPILSSVNACQSHYVPLPSLAAFSAAGGPVQRPVRRGR
jgi:hypothetical protein